MKFVVIILSVLGVSGEPEWFQVRHTDFANEQECNDFVEAMYGHKFEFYSNGIWYSISDDQLKHLSIECREVGDE